MSKSMMIQVETSRFRFELDGADLPLFVSSVTEVLESGETTYGLNLDLAEAIRDELERMGLWE